MSEVIDRAPIIVTAAMDRVTATRFDALRRTHFPAERNQVPAHVTLFHLLPGSEFASISGRLKMMARGCQPIAGTVAALFSLGGGVAYRIDSPEMERVRVDLAEAWWTWLMQQDRGNARLHVTVQNKVEEKVARTTLALLQAGFAPTPMRFIGFDLWRYRGGPWEPAGTARFRA